MANTTPPAPTVGFDLDMTLIDSRPGIKAVYDRLAAETGVHIDSELAVTRLGPPLDDELANWFPADRIPEMSDRYRALYPEHAIVPTPAMPGAIESIAAVRAAGAALQKHEELVALIRERGDDPTSLMLPFREPLDAFRRATHGVRPQETMLSVHITAGMLDDFYLALSSSYGDTGRRVARILQADDDRQAIVDIIGETIASDPEWKSLLAMWGRRLVGDTLLIARAALRPTTLRIADEQKVEPVFTDLMGAHSRRMDAMGLAA